MELLHLDGVLAVWRRAVLTGSILIRIPRLSRRFWFGAAGAALMINCGNPVPENPTKYLVGEYETYIGQTYLSQPSDRLVSEKLVLRSDGTFSQFCDFEKAPDYHYDGEWKASELGVHFSQLRDCWVGSGGGSTGKYLVVEWRPRNILQHPDLNVFYHPIAAK